MKKGFTLIELLVIIFIVSTLAAIVSTNFSRARNQQIARSGADDLVSKIRQLQTAILAGQEVRAGEAADAYEINLRTNQSRFEVYYIIEGTRTRLETPQLLDQVSINNLIVGNVPQNLIVVRLDAPFGKISVEGTVNASAQIDLIHTESSASRSVIIDGISGRVNSQ